MLFKISPAHEYTSWPQILVVFAVICDGLSYSPRLRLANRLKRGVAHRPLCKKDVTCW